MRADVAILSVTSTELLRLNACLSSKPPSLSVIAISEHICPHHVPSLSLIGGHGTLWKLYVGTLPTSPKPHHLDPCLRKTRFLCLLAVFRCEYKYLLGCTVQLQKSSSVFKWTQFTKIFEADSD